MKFEDYDQEIKTAWLYVLVIKLCKRFGHVLYCVVQF